MRQIVALTVVMMARGENGRPATTLRAQLLGENPHWPLRVGMNITSERVTI